MKTKYLSALMVMGVMSSVSIPAIAESSDAPKFKFSCKVIKGIPTTLAQAVASKATQPIFHWKSDATAFKSSATPQQLCNNVSTQLEEYSASGYDLSQISFVGTEEKGIPLICANTSGGLDCSKVLVTLSAANNPAGVASEVVDSILDKDLQPKVIKSNVRGVQSTSYQVNFWSLLGLGLDHKFLSK
ncbi:COP23 domain-containing protein [Pleurocapsa sp. FMAR1]|uniref:COP23 domain-containing protein n=1 Tax=Pleurocapsa sp. FMAR1 TaxID=3040204 RepID=UPI0029C62621|nr:COP23 domain-containing protein [Pleurocapsa sp. FMAR1]